MVRFDYNKENAKCLWCKRTDNPHPNFNEPIPTKVFVSNKRREIELCISCYETEIELSNRERVKFEYLIDDRFEKLLVLDSIDKS